MFSTCISVSDTRIKATGRGVCEKCKRDVTRVLIESAPKVRAWHSMDHTPTAMYVTHSCPSGPAEQRKAA